MDVFFYEAFEEEAAALAVALPKGITAGFAPTTIQECSHTAPPAPIVSIRTQSRIPPSWPPHLEALLTRSTGYDHLAAFREQCSIDIPCGYLPLYCSRAVAEHAMLLWTALLRRLPLQLSRFARFQRDGMTGSECAGRSLLIVGVGNIGLEIARVGEGLDMRVLGVDIVQRHPSVSYVSFEKGLLEADVIVCAMNLTKQNHGYFHYERLAGVRPGAVFINIARGEMSPAEDLHRLLEENRLGGVGLDVFEEEFDLAPSMRAAREGSSGMPPALEALARHPRVILTPHNAFNTREAVARKAADTARQIACFTETHRFLWPIPGPES